VTLPATAYSAVIATYRRPDSLRVVLDSLTAQTIPPALIVVADNDPDRSAAPVVDAVRAGCSIPTTYLALGRNAGPAGGWAQAAASVQEHAARGTWLLVIDDDDRLGHTQVVERLLSGARHVPDPSRCAAVGLRGAALRRGSGRLVRREGPEGMPLDVDYLASGGAPLYRWDALEEVGFFDERLFFGFEDLDEGLRLRKAGWSLWAIPLPSIHHVADTSPIRTPWREYYKTRALTTITRRHLPLSAMLFLVVRTVVLGSLRLAMQGRRSGLARARVAGWIDGMRGQLGPRRYDPSTNPPKLQARPRP
jgi:GT2 family glycosyltransferase